MSLSFKYIPLSFQTDQVEIKQQIVNTLVLKYIYKTTGKTESLGKLVEGTQYGYNASAQVEGRNKFLRISDIKNGNVDWDTVPYCNCEDEKTYLLKSNDILIARTGGTTGKSFMISEPPKLSIYAGYLIRIRANESNNPNFIKLFLNSYAYWSQIVSLNEDNFRPRVNANSLKSLIVPIGSSQIQHDAIRISQGENIKGYDALYSEISQMEKCNELEYEYQKAILQIQKLKEAMILDAFMDKTEVEV
tara:strand:- start:124 stop:864 length:741 start_codon:yes stop_codon:yes gene_type:complete